MGPSLSVSALTVVSRWNQDRNLCLRSHTTVLFSFLFHQFLRISSSELTTVSSSFRADTFSAAAEGHLTPCRLVSTLDGSPPEDFQKGGAPPGKSLKLPVFLPCWRSCSESQALPHSYEVVKVMALRPVYRGQQRAWRWWCYDPKEAHLFMAEWLIQF